MKLNKIFKRLIFSGNIKNSAWIIGEQIFQMLLSLIVGMLSARYLGPSNYGTLNYTASFVSFFINIASLCMEGVVIKKMVNYPDKEGVYLGSCILYRVIASSLSMISIAIIVYILNPGDMLKLTLVVLQSFQLFFKSFNLFDSWFQRYLKSKYTSIGKMIASLLVSGYKLFLLMTGKSIIWFAIANTLSDLVMAVMLYFFYRGEKGQKLRINFAVGNEVLSESYHFILSEIMSALYINMDRIMIGQIMDDSDVGYYIAANTVAGLWAFVPTAIINSYRPSIMELKKSGSSLYDRRLTQLFSIVIWVCVFFSVGSFIFAGLLVRVLFGETYIEAVGAFKILIWAQMLSVISVTRNIWIICEDKNRYVKYYVGIGVVINLILNLALIPVIGIDGASYATLATSVVVLLIAPILFKETRGQMKYLLGGLTLSWLRNGE